MSKIFSRKSSPFTRLAGFNPLVNWILFGCIFRLSLPIRRREVQEMSMTREYRWTNLRELCVNDARVFSIVSLTMDRMALLSRYFWLTPKLMICEDFLIARESKVIVKSGKSSNGTYEYRRVRLESTPNVGLVTVGKTLEESLNLYHMRDSPDYHQTSTDKWNKVNKLQYVPIIFPLSL